MRVDELERADELPEERQAGREGFGECAQDDEEFDVFDGAYARGIFGDVGGDEECYVGSIWAEVRV